jgi:hypothetical protein
MKNIVSMLLAISVILGIGGIVSLFRANHRAQITGRDLAVIPRDDTGPAPLSLNITIAPDDVASDARLDKFSRFSWQVYANGVKTDD